MKVPNVLAVLTLLALGPTLASAQSGSTAAIAGVARDATGAVLPGVTVEAGSPALIEKVRSVVTDSEGQYKIVDLRPGVYSVTFSLPGFSIVKREGIELTTGFTATVNAELRVGSLEETITVTGQSPVVDTQNTNQQRVMSRAVLETVPTNNAVQGFAAVIPGAVLSGGQRGIDVGGSSSDSNVTMAVHGTRGGDLKVFMDGMGIATMMGNGGGTSRHYSFNPTSAEEIVIQLSGTTAEAETSGIQMNMVPRDGGNVLKGIFEANFTNSDLQATNLTDELIARGVNDTPQVRKIYAARGGFGGPIKKDKLWFYGDLGRWRSTNEIPNNWFNQTPQSLFYTADLSRKAITDYPYDEQGIRVTWQPSPKHKITGLYSDESGICICFWSVDQGGFRPEATIHLTYDPVRVAQFTWSSPVSNRLLVQAGLTRVIDFGKNLHATESSIGARAVTDLSDGFQYGSRYTGATLGLTDYSVGRGNNTSSYNTRFSVSYVTGSHAFKVGLFHTHGLQTLDLDTNYPEAYTFRNRVPVSITQIVTPLLADARLRMNLAAFVQDQWTVRNLTLNAGARFTYHNTYLPALQFPAGKYSAGASFPAIDPVLDWKDITPRLGASYDLFGDGRTAIKAFVGRYLVAESLGITLNQSASGRLVPSATRTWADGNGNYVPDCNLLNYSANGECGALSNSSLGGLRATTRYDDAVTRGWNVRPQNWQTSVGLQRQLRPGIGMEVGYYRTSFGKQNVTDNLALGPGDFDPFCITTPRDSRLPEGGGNQICGLSDIKPASFGRPVDNLVVQASTFGKLSEVSQAIDITTTARFGRGGMLGGGLGITRTVIDACSLGSDPSVTASMTLPNISYVSFPTGPSAPQQFCRITAPFGSQAQLKLSGSYPLPWFGLEVGGALQSVPGPAVLASYVATNAEILPSLGRNLGACRGAAVCNGTVTVANIVEPNALLEDRRNQLDLRLTKYIRFGKVRVRGSMDLYNTFNSSAIIQTQTRYATNNTWLRPAVFMPARLFKFGMQLDF